MVLLDIVQSAFGENIYMTFKIFANVHQLMFLVLKLVWIRIEYSQWRSQLQIMVPPCRAEGATPLGGFGGMPPRENFEM